MEVMNRTTRCSLAGFTILLLALFAGSRFTHAAESSASEEWDRLQPLLRDCTGVTTNPSPLAESTMLPEAPLLGNGEVGVAVGGNQKRLTLFIDHAFFRRYTLGGVDIIAEGISGPMPLAVRHEQDIERAEVRSQVPLNGLPVEATSWLATERPLVFCQLRNPSDQPLSLRVSTWTRPPLDNLRVNPFRLTPGTGRDAEYGLNDDEGRVTYGPPPADGTELWTMVEREGTTHLRNLGTGRYLALFPGGQLKTISEPDATTAFAHQHYGWTRASHFCHAKTGKYLGVSGPYPAKGRAAAWAPVTFDKPYDMRIEYAAHRFLPNTAGLIGNTCWAWRSYEGGGYTMNAAIVTSVLGVAATAKDASFTLVLPPRGSATVAIAVTGDCNVPQKAKSLEQCRHEGQTLVDALTSDGVQALSDQRIADWRSYWLKAWLDTGDRLLNRYWYGAFYMLKCTSRAGQQSPALYGVWNMSDNPVCNNAEFNNYNYQSQHYGTFTANRPELATPQFDDILKYLPTAQQHAARAGYHGVMWPRGLGAHASDPPPTVFPLPPVAPHKNRKALPNDQLDAPAFLAMNFLYAYESTLDREFLEHKAYPMVRACMDFYTDYLVLTNGRYELHESAAREGTSDNNPTYPLAFIKRLAAACADYSEILGVDADRRAKWRDIATRMSVYPTATVNGKTVFKETESNDRIALVGPGDNVSLLQLVHPGAGVGLDSNSKLLETARNTLAWFNSNPKRPSWLQKDNNLPQIFTDAATLGWDADDLYQWFHRYLREEERPNLTYQGWGIEGAGATEAIHRMMLQSHEDVLRFFPVWPRDKDAQFTRLRARGAFLVTARLKNGVVEGVTITSTKGTDCAIVNPWPGKKVQVLRAGKPSESLSGERFTLKTAIDETIALTPNQR
jgi:hypothetical protein